MQSQADGLFRKKIAERVMKRLPQAEPSAVASTTEFSFMFIQSETRGAFVREDGCFSLTLLLTLLGTHSGSVMSGPLMRDRLIDVYVRIELARESYFEALGKLTDGDD